MTFFLIDVIAVDYPSIHGRADGSGVRTRLCGTCWAWSVPAASTAVRSIPGLYTRWEVHQYSSIPVHLYIRTESYLPWIRKIISMG